MQDQFEVQQSVLPSELGVRFGPATKPPSEEEFYENRYEPPQHSVKQLQKLNPASPDLQFFEGPHVYQYKGVPASASVTEIVHSVEPDFVATAAINAMRNSSKQAWPRFEYVVDADKEREWDASLGLLFRNGEITVASIPPYSLSAGTTLEEATKIAKLSSNGIVDDDAVSYTYTRVLTDAEIAEEWKRNGNEASARGTEAHHQAELFFNGEPARWWHPDLENAVWFAKTHMENMEARYTEFEIYYPEADLAGSIDLIVFDRARRLHHIIDHKRSEKLPREMRGYGKLLEPMQHLDKCKGAVYALQLSLYQYILEKVYGFECGDRVLLTLHPGAPEYATSVPYLKEEVEFLMRRRIALVAARRAAVAKDATLKCSLTGAPVHEAVRLRRDGSVAARRAALVRGLEFEEDVQTTKRFRESVEEELEDVAPPAKWTKGSWRRRMPERGLAPFHNF